MLQRNLACLAGTLLIAVSAAAAVDWNDPQSVVAAALTASPSLRELDANLGAARARQRGAGATPNPMLMAGVQNQPIDLSTDPMMTMYTVGVSQTFVRRQRRDALQRAAQLEVQRLERQSESRRAEIARDVLVAYDEAAAANNQIEANAEVAKLAAMMAEAARARYEVGTAAQIDIIRAKLEASNVQHQILMQRGLRNIALARLRALLNLPPVEDIPPFALAHAMEHHAHGANISLAESTAAITTLESEVERAEQDIRLAKLATSPDLNIEASYGLRPQQNDMFSVVARIELPVRRKITIEPHIAEAMARRDAARAEIDVLRQQLAADFGEAVASRNEAVEQINLHVEQLVPEAKLGFDSALASYQAGKSTFDSMLGALQAYRELNVDYFEFLRQLLIAEAEIDALNHGAAGTSEAAGIGGAR